MDVGVSDKVLAKEWMSMVCNTIFYLLTMFRS